MSIQEKKSSKGTPFAHKFSDLKSEFEYFYFQTYLLQIEKFLKLQILFLTLQKDPSGPSSNTRRVNVKNLVNLDDMLKSLFKC